MALCNRECIHELRLRGESDEVLLFILVLEYNAGQSKQLLGDLNQLLELRIPLQGYSAQIISTLDFQDDHC